MELTLNISEYGYEKKVLFANTSVSFYSGKLYLLKGENGCGKTTLFSLLSGQIFDEKVTIFLNSKKLEKKDYNSFYEDYVSYMTQDSLVFDNLTVKENLLLPFEKKDFEKARKILEILELDSIENSLGKDLSLGEKQRLCFGRILYQPKKIVLLDECFSCLDEQSARILKENIQRLAMDRIVLLISHVEVNFDSFILCSIKDRKIAIEGTPHKEGSDREKRALKKHISVLKALSENRVLFSVMSIFSIVFTSLALLFSSFSNAVMNTEHQRDLSYQVLEKYADYYFLSSSSFRKIESDLTKDEYVPIVTYTNSTIFDYETRKTGMVASFGLTSFSDIPLVKGTYPIDETEVLISSDMEEMMSDFTEAQKYQFITQSCSSATKISGVYQAASSSKRDEYLTNKSEFTGSNIYRLSFSYQVETIYTKLTQANKVFVSAYAVFNNSHTKKLVTSDMVSSIPSDFLLFDKEGDSQLEKLKPFSFPYWWILLSGFLLSSLFFLFSFCSSNKRKYLILRTLGKGRESLLCSSFSAFLITMIFSVLLSFLFTFIGIAISNAILSQGMMFETTLPFVFFSFGKPVLFFFMAYLLVLLSAYLLLAFFFLPKDLKRQIQDLRQK